MIQMTIFQKQFNVIFINKITPKKKHNKSNFIMPGGVLG